MRILLLIVCFTLFYSSDAKTTYHKHFTLSTDSLYLIPQGDCLSNLIIEARVAVNKNKERVGESSSRWSIIWNYKSSNDFNYIELTWENTNFGDFLDYRRAKIKVGEIRKGVDNVLKTTTLDKNVNMYTGYNSISIEISGDKYNVFVGDNKLCYIGSFLFKDKIRGNCGIKTTIDAKISRFVIETTPDMKLMLQSKNTLKSLNTHFSTKKNLHEGFWSYLDRNNNEDYAIVGGRYRFALLKEGNDYLIIYINGAVTNKKNWSEGMIKGRLISTIFENHYDLIWYDSMFELIDVDAHASINNSILTIEFPTYKTQIRFYREQ